MKIKCLIVVIAFALNVGGDIANAQTSSPSSFPAATLSADTEKTLRAVLKFMDVPASEAQVKEAMEYSSLENMKKMEQSKTFWLSGGRMAPKDPANPHSYKVRRGKVGGFRDYFEDDQVEQIETLMASTLSP